MSSEENKQIARRAFAALESGDLSPLHDLLAPDAVIHQCGFLQPLPAQALLQGRLPGARLVRDRSVRLERMIAEGDLVALHWRMTGHYSDPDSPQRDGTPVSFPSMTFLRIADRKIAEIWNIQDMSTLQSQLWEAVDATQSA